jgi:hypothetical protein
MPDEDSWIYSMILSQRKILPTEKFKRTQTEKGYIVDIKGIVHKVIVLAGQTVNSAYHCDVLQRLRENVRRLCPEPWRQKIWLLHHDNASLFTREFLTKSNMIVVHQQPC